MIEFIGTSLKRSGESPLRANRRSGRPSESERDMSSFAERIAKEYDAKYVYPATKDDVLRFLDELKGVIASLDDFSAFPEGRSGIVLYALLRVEARSCPDAGDFSHAHQGLQTALTASYEDLVELVVGGRSDA